MHTPVNPALQKRGSDARKDFEFSKMKQKKVGKEKEKASETELCGNLYPLD